MHNNQALEEKSRKCARIHCSDHGLFTPKFRSVLRKIAKENEQTDLLEVVIDTTAPTVSTQALKEKGISSGYVFYTLCFVIPLEELRENSSSISKLVKTIEAKVLENFKQYIVVH